MNRKLSRAIAMELLFQRTINVEEVHETVETFKDNTDHDIEKIDLEYIEDILTGVLTNLQAIDLTIEKNLVNWKINRISKINLSILRLATYEVLFRDDIPNTVAVNEAIEIAKQYSDEKSVKFINGVLDKVIKSN